MRMKILFQNLFFIFFLSIAFVTLSAVEGVSQGTWTQKANVGSTGRWAAIGFSIGNRGYVTLGENQSSVFVTDLWEYNPSTNAWTQKANFPGPGRQLPASFSIGNKGYIGTGWSGSAQLNDLWEYDPATNAWQQKANFPGSPRAQAVGLSIGNFGYIGLGKGA